MTLSEERASSSRRAHDDEAESGPHTAAFPSLDTAAFGATRLEPPAGDPETTWFAADPATSWFGAAEYPDDADLPEDPEISELTEDPRLAEHDPSARTSVFTAAPADDADVTSTMAPFDPESTSTMAPFDGETIAPFADETVAPFDGESTSTVAPFDPEATSTMAPFAPAEVTTAMPPVDAPSPAETTTAIPPAVDPAEETTVAPSAPTMVVGSRGVRRAAPAAPGPDGAAPPTTPPAPPAPAGMLGVLSGPRGMMLRLLMVLVALAGVIGTVVVTEPHLLTGFKSSPEQAEGPLTTLAPAPPLVNGMAPPGGMLPGMPLVPPMGAAPIGAPPPPLAPGLPLGATPPAAGQPAAALPRPGGIGVGDVLGALFDSGKGDFASHFDNSGNSGLIENGYYPSVVPNPQFPGRQAFQMALAPGGKRSEVLPVGPGTQPVDGEQQFVRYSAILGPNFPVYTDGFQLIMQWHHQSNDGSPPLALQVNRGVLNMVSGGDNVAVIGPVAPGQPINLTMQIRFSSNPGLASVSVWRDGRPAIVDWHPVRGTMFTPAAYLKMGMYRSEAIMQGGAVTITDLKIGQTPNAIGGLGPLAPR